MIDLHMHTQYSDGTEDCVSILKKCQEKGLDYISITDHNTATAYKELENIDIPKYFKGNIIPGIELNTKVLNIPIEILGYGIDYDKMCELAPKIYIDPSKRNLIEAERLYNKCLKYGIILDDDCLEKYTPESFASGFFHKQITKYEENKKLISSEAWESSKILYRQYMSDPNAPLYVEMDDLVPDFETASSLIRQCGGLVFLPHIYEYKHNSTAILNYILQNHSIDGIECFYTTFSTEQHNRILQICRNRNLFISGGTDFHGTFKPEVDIGNGYGNLQIPTEIISNWVPQISLFNNRKIIQRQTDTDFSR